MHRRHMNDIDVDTAILLGIVQHTENKIELFDWPEDLCAALALALDGTTVSTAEAEKASLLKRHLFGDLLSPFVGGRANVPQRWTERIRADLPGIVDFGSGFHLIDPKALAQKWLTTER